VPSQHAPCGPEGTTLNAPASSNSVVFERRRTGWDIVLGLLSVVAGVVALGHVAIVGVVSVLFLGWVLLLGGLVLVVAAVVLWKEANHRWNLAAGALFLLIGFSFVRNPGIGLLTLTLVAGSLLLVGGVVRIVAAFQPAAPRAILLLNGGVTLLLGLMVLNRWPVSALWFLGTILGIQLILDGVTTALVGRVRVAGTPERTHEAA
jgi:membrane protein HdeD